jgi:hypothetical protein
MSSGREFGVVDHSKGRDATMAVEGRGAGGDLRLLQCSRATLAGLERGRREKPCQNKKKLI